MTQFRNTEQKSFQRKSAAAYSTTRPAIGLVIEDKRGVAGEVEQKGNGIIQGAWYDKDGTMHGGRPFKGWIKKFTKEGKPYWIDPGNKKENDDIVDNEVEESENSEESVKDYYGDISSEEVDDDDPRDENWEDKKPKKPVDPNSKIKKGTLKKNGDDLEYETESGIKHVETYDSKNKKRKSISTNLLLNGDFRNSTIKEKNQYQVFNPYNLSNGQLSLNQMVISHNTPSVLGMSAGGNYGNYSLTSPRFNSLIESNEKKIRKNIKGKIRNITYTTKTEYEDVQSEDASEIEKEIKNLYPNTTWDKDRIKIRLRKVKEKYPQSKRVKKEKRIIEQGGKTESFEMGRDLTAFLPRRSYDEKAYLKYYDARKQDSEASDEELEYKPKKKKKTKK